MNVALSHSKRLLIIVLTVIMTVAGLNALQLVAASAANAAPAAGPSLTCNEGYDGCKSSFNVGGYDPPSTDGDFTPGGSGGGDGTGFAFLAPCGYNVKDGTGASYGTSNVYPISAKRQADAYAQCGSEGDFSGNRVVTSRTRPQKYHDLSAQHANKGCPAIRIDGSWTAATGMYNYTAGWQKVVGSTPTRWRIHFDSSCVYPSKSAKSFGNPWTRTCMLDGIYRVYYSTNASTIKNNTGAWGNGVQQDQSARIKPDPNLNQNKAINCTQTLNSRWENYRLTQSTEYGGPLYGFYRFTVQGRFVNCTGTDPAAWTNNKPESSCDMDNIRTAYDNVNYTYTCKASGFRADASPNQSDSEYFRPAGCIDYTCNISSTLIAQQSPSTAVSVLRNGEQTNTRIGNFTVSGNGLRDIENKRVKLNVIAGSSPNNPSVGSNSDDEWFRVMNQVTGQRIDFGTWQPLANNTTRLKAGLIFYWASDPDAHWQMRQAYEFDGRYYVYRQDRLSQNAYKSYIFQPDEVCSNTTTSSKVTALRSINQVSR